MDLPLYCPRAEVIDTRVTIKFYLSRLSRGELRRLRQYAEHVQDRAPRLCKWLYDQAIDEGIRREAMRVRHPPEDKKLEDGECVEPTYPAIDLLNYSHSEIAGALEVITSISYAMQDERTGQFIDKLVITITAHAGDRLRKIDHAMSNVQSSD